MRKRAKDYGNVCERKQLLFTSVRVTVREKWIDQAVVSFWMQPVRKYTLRVISREDSAVEHGWWTMDWREEWTFTQLDGEIKAWPRRRFCQKQKSFFRTRSFYFISYSFIHLNSPKLYIHKADQRTRKENMTILMIMAKTNTRHAHISRCSALDEDVSVCVWTE